MPLPRDLYQFGDVCLDVLNLRLTVSGEPRALEPKSFRTLQFLIENRHRAVHKEEIFSTVWEGIVVTDNALARVIAQIRKALDDDPRQPRYIETIQTIGYRFRAELAVPPTATSEEAPAPMSVPVFAKSSPIQPWRWAVIGTLVAAVLILLYSKITSTQSIDSIAVLPFANGDHNAEVDYLSEGITESLRASLSELPNLKVMSRSAVARYQDQAVDTRSAGRELGVRAVLAGRVIQHGESLTISAELVDVENNTQLWGGQYQRKPVELLDVQNEIAQQIVDRLHAQITRAQRQRLTTRQTTNREAYQAYLKGRYFAGQFTQAGLTKGLAYLREAIGLDPTYALAYDGLAYYHAISDDITAPPADSMPQAAQAARTALTLDDSLVEAHVELGTVHFFYDFDWAATEREFTRAIALNPDYAPAHGYYGWYLTSQGRVEQGLQESRQAVALDPLSPEFHSLLGWNLYFARRYDQALVELNKALEIAPDYPLGLYILGQIYAQQQRYAEAISAEQKAAEIFGAGGNSWPLAEIARDYFLAGKLPEANKILHDLLDSAASSHVTPFGLATIYLASGGQDQAIAQLEQAYTQRSWFLDNLQVDPELDSVRSDPRFKALSARMNLR